MNTPCEIAGGARDRNAYVVVADGTGSSTTAHRRVYEIAYGEQPHGVDIDHLCGNRACVRLDHLEAVPHVVNCQRGRSTKLSANDVLAIRGAYETGSSLRQLAGVYGVDYTHISRIVRREVWRNV